MKERLRRAAPLLIGSGTLLLVLDVLMLAYRALGLAKVPAIYAALLTLLVAAVLLTRRYLGKTPPK